MQLILDVNLQIRKKFNFMFQSHCCREPGYIDFRGAWPNSELLSVVLLHYYLLGFFLSESTSFHGKFHFLPLIAPIHN